MYLLLHIAQASANHDGAPGQGNATQSPGLLGDNAGLGGHQGGHFCEC